MAYDYLLIQVKLMRESVEEIESLIRILAVVFCVQFLFMVLILMKVSK